MENIVQPLRQFVLHIRSKDVAREGDLNSHLFIDLAEPININPINEEIHQQVLSCEIPYSFYNISSSLKNDTIVYTTGGVETTFIFPSKDYTITEYVRVMTDDNSFPFTATYDEFTMKISLQNTSANTITINWTKSTTFKAAGFKNNVDVDVVSGGITISDNIIDMATVHSIMLKSNTSSNMVFSTRSGFSQTIQKISVDTNSGDIIYLNQNDSRQTTVLHNNIDVMDIRLTDQNDNLINLNGINYEITFGFFIYPIQKQIPTTILTSNRRALTPPPPEIQPPPNNPRMAPFTPSNIIRDINTVNTDLEDHDNHYTDLEHQGNRLIIDELINKMKK